MSGQTSQHSFVLVVKSRKGFRHEYGLTFNGHNLKGKVVRTMKKGKEVWQTWFGKKSVDRYDPQWLCRKNGRIVKVPLDHPSMWHVKQIAEQEMDQQIA